MTPPSQDPPQTVLDLLFTPGEDSPTAVVPELLSPGATGDLGRALQNVPATLREAAVRETINAAKGLLDVDLTGFLVSGWQKHREVLAAARRTVAAPGSIELVNLATHQITATQRPVVNLVVDNRAWPPSSSACSYCSTSVPWWPGSGEDGSSRCTPAAATSRPPWPSRTPRSPAGRFTSSCPASSRSGGESACCLTTATPARATRRRRRQWPDHLIRDAAARCGWLTREPRPDG